MRLLFSVAVGFLVTSSFCRAGDVAAQTSLELLREIQDLGEKGEPRSIRSASFSSDGKRLALGGYGAQILGTEDWGILRKIGLNGPIFLSPDGETLVCQGTDFLGRPSMWSVATGEEIMRWKWEGGGVTAGALSSDGKTFATAEEAGGGGKGNEPRIRLFDVATGTELRCITLGHDSTVVSLAFSPDGKSLASGGRDGLLRLWEVPTGKPLYVKSAYGAVADFMKGKTVHATAVTFSPDGKLLATGISLPQEGKAEKDVVRIWDVGTGEPRLSIPAHKNCVGALCFSPDGRILAAIGSVDHRVRLWDTGSGKAVAEAKHDGIVSMNQVGIAFSTDGMTLVSACGTTAKLWSVKSGR